MFTPSMLTYVCCLILYCLSCVSVLLLLLPSSSLSQVSTLVRDLTLWLDNLGIRLHVTKQECLICHTHTQHSGEPQCPSHTNYTTLTSLLACHHGWVSGLRVRESVIGDLKWRVGAAATHRCADKPCIAHTHCHCRSGMHADKSSSETRMLGSPIKYCCYGCSCVT